MGEKGGMKGFYTAIVPISLLTLKPGLQLAFYEAVKRVILARRKGDIALSAFHAFLLGAFSRLLATIVVFPYIRGKQLMQTGRIPGQGTGLVSLHRIMIRCVEEHGIGGLYQSMPQELLRACFSSSLMFACRE